MSNRRNCNTFYFCLVFAGFMLSLPTIADAANKKTPTHIQECDMSIIAPDDNYSEISTRQVPAILVDAFLPSSEHQQRVSKVCEFAFNSSLAYNVHRAGRVIFTFTDTEYRVRVYYWRKTKKEWKALPTEMNRASHTVSADVPFGSSIVAAFADETPFYEGTVSWYRHKRYPNGSATNLYPTGTKLTVTNLENGKSVDVTITSTWTNTDDRRILDLVSTAFQKIANLRTGLITARIERKGYNDPFEKKNKSDDSN